MDTTGRRGSLIAGLAFPLLIVGLLVLVFAFRHQIWDIFSTPVAVRTWISEWGLAAPLIFLGAQIVQVLVFVIPGETVQIAGGYLFGFGAGLALTTGGIAIGSALNFYLARALGPAFVHRFFPPDRVARLEQISCSSKAQIGFFLLFVIPGIPKDILCYVAGLSPMRFGWFLAVSMVGRLPGIAGSTLMGSAAAGQRWVLAVSLLVLATALFVLGYVYRDRLQDWIESHAAPPHE